MADSACSSCSSAESCSSESCEGCPSSKQPQSFQEKLNEYSSVRFRMIRAITGSIPKCSPIVLKSAPLADTTHFSFTVYSFFSQCNLKVKQ